MTTADVRPAEDVLRLGFRQISLSPRGDVRFQKPLLEVWNGLSAFTAGVLPAVVYTAVSAGGRTRSARDDSFVSIAMRISVVAAVLAPFVFRPMLKSRRGANWAACGPAKSPIGLSTSARWTA